MLLASFVSQRDSFATFSDGVVFVCLNSDNCEVHLALGKACCVRVDSTGPVTNLQKCLVAGVFLDYETEVEARTVVDNSAGMAERNGMNAYVQSNDLK